MTHHTRTHCSVEQEFDCHKASRKRNRARSAHNRFHVIGGGKVYEWWGRLDVDSVVPEHRHAVYKAHACERADLAARASASQKYSDRRRRLRSEPTAVRKMATVAARRETSAALAYEPAGLRARRGPGLRRAPLPCIVEILQIVAVVAGGTHIAHSAHQPPTRTARCHGRLRRSVRRDAVSQVDEQLAPSSAP
mmetsp:Transcript_22857/g.69972  ORF Transcript_22857/g.69972 Transcript_22857/m.69972 type:complete len:193 (+) Transcript_22857:177-755(+)